MSWQNWIDTPNITGANANVLSNDDFANSNDRTNGFKAGQSASAINVNSGLRQANLISIALMKSLGIDGSNYGPAFDETTLKNTITTTLNNKIKTTKVDKASTADNATGIINSFSNNDITSFGDYAVLKRVRLYASPDRDGAIVPSGNMSTNKYLTLTLSNSNLTDSDLTEIMNRMLCLDIVVNYSQEVYENLLKLPYSDTTNNIWYYGGERHLFVKLDYTNSDQPEILQVQLGAPKVYQNSDKNGVHDVLLMQYGDVNMRSINFQHITLVNDSNQAQDEVKIRAIYAIL